MVIDIHCHPPRRDADGTVLREMIRLAHQCGIDKLVLLGRVGEDGPHPTPEQIRESNDETVTDVLASPDDLFGFCYLSPEHPESFLREEVQRTIGEGSLCGIKLWIAVNARDKRCDAVMELAEQHGVPVLHHSWYKTVQQYEDESSPADIADLARRFPQVDIIMAHLNGCGYRGVADVIDCPNITVDTSGSQPEQGVLEYAVRLLGAARLVFGSDVPGRDFAPQLAKVSGAAIDESARAQILGGNAARLLRLVNNS